MVVLSTTTLLFPTPPLISPILRGCQLHTKPSSLLLKYNQYISISTTTSPAAAAAAAQKEDNNTVVEEEEEEEYTVLSAINSAYNDILILDTPKSRMLLLDSTHNIHSIFIKGVEAAWTGSYWDDFATLPPIIPDGPIAILGLAAGTAAHLMLSLFPSLHLHGWEIDQILIDKARQHLGLSHLENPTHAGGCLHVHIGDALSNHTSIPGGYAGIVVDLFSKGEVLPQLQQLQTWLDLKDKLMPNGRLIINCGATTNLNGPSNSFRDNNSTLDVLCKAFPGQVNWKKTPKSEGDNHLALTGPLPDFTTWSAALPHPLNSSVMQWTSCFPK